jgi:hypothetical protein
MEPAGSGATWTGSPKGVFAGRKHHKPRLALNNNTAGVCERKDANRTRVAGNRDEVEGVVARLLALIRSGAVGFIDWLGLLLGSRDNGSAACALQDALPHDEKPAEESTDKRHHDDK